MKDKVVVFMKGVPEQPMCGFSNAVVQILRMHGVEGYGSYNVLEDEELRQKVKEYSSWPTIPQVYVGGEFVGGCDIMLQMHQSGDLIDELQKVGIKSMLLEKAEEDKNDKWNYQERSWVKFSRRWSQSDTMFHGSWYEHFGLRNINIVFKLRKSTSISDKTQDKRNGVIGEQYKLSSFFHFIAEIAINMHALPCYIECLFHNNC